MKQVLLLFSLVILLVACQSEDRSPIKVEMYNNSDDVIGTAKITEQPEGVQFKLSLEGMQPGFHGIHVHEFAKCENPDFKTAGSHYNPNGKQHGLMHPKGAHLGDLPNIEVGGDGTVNAELMLPEATLMDGKNSLLSNDGTSLIIHEGQDDGVSQPSGDSGARIACGKIQMDTNQDEAPTDPTESNKKQEKQK